MYLLQSFTSSCTATWPQLPGASSKLLAVVLAVLPGGLSIMPTVLDICPCSTLWQIPPTQLGATWPHRACGTTLLVSSPEDICLQTLMPSTCLWPPGKCIGLYFTWSCTPHSIGTHTHTHTNTHQHKQSQSPSFLSSVMSPRLAFVPQCVHFMAMPETTSLPGLEFLRQVANAPCSTHR